MAHTAGRSPEIHDRIIDPALLMVAFLWGAGTVVTKWLLEVFDPAAFLALRMSVTAVLMIAVMLTMPRRRASFRDWLMISGFGGGLVAAQHLAFVCGIKMTTASEGSLLLSTAPVWTAVIVAILGMELVKGINWFGIAVALGGVAMIVFGSAREAALSFPAHFSGNLLIIASAWMFGGYMVVSKKWMQRFGGVRVVCHSFAAAGVLLAVVCGHRLRATEWAAITWGHWMGIAYITLVAGLVGLIVWYHTVGRTSASGTAVYLFLVPGVSVIGAMIFLRERLTALQIAGIVVTLVGVCLARVRPGAGASGIRARQA